MDKPEFSSTTVIDRITRAGKRLRVNVTAFEYVGVECSLDDEVVVTGWSNPVVGPIPVGSRPKGAEDYPYIACGRVLLSDEEGVALLEALARAHDATDRVMGRGKYLSRRSRLDMDLCDRLDRDDAAAAAYDAAEARAEGQGRPAVRESADPVSYGMGLDHNEG